MGILDIIDDFYGDDEEAVDDEPETQHEIGDSTEHSLAHSAEAVDDEPETQHEIGDSTEHSLAHSAVLGEGMSYPVVALWTGDTQKPSDSVLRVALKDLGLDPGTVTPNIDSDLWSAKGYAATAIAEKPGILVATVVALFVQKYGATWAYVGSTTDSMGSAATYLLAKGEDVKEAVGETVEAVADFTGFMWTVKWVLLALGALVGAYALYKVTR